MDLEWQLENPAIALKKYYCDVGIFATKKETNEIFEGELESQKGELSAKQVRLEELKSKLLGMGEYVKGDVDSMIRSAHQDAQEKIDIERANFDAGKNQLEAQKDNSIKDNDAWLEKRLKQLLGDNADINREFSTIERKALEFEIARRQFVTASNEKIVNYQDAIVQEELDCKTIVGTWKHEQDDIYAKFEPDIVKYKNLIDDINHKYQPDIRQCQNLVSEKVAARDKEIGQLQLERDRVIQLANNEIAGYQRDYKQTQKQYGEQITMAKLHNKPTTRMENSRTSRLNAINDQIQKVNNRVNKKVSGIAQKIEVVSDKHAGYIEKAEQQLNNVIGKRDRELSEPTLLYNQSVQERDNQLAAIQAQIDHREEQRNIRLNNLNAEITQEKNAQENYNFELDRQIIAFTMSGETCFSDVLDEVYAPFTALHGKVNTWMELLSLIKKDKMPPAYVKEHEKQMKLLASMDYFGLQKELVGAQQFNNSISVFAKNNSALTIGGSIFAGIGIVLLVLLYAILKMPIGMIGLVMSLLGMGVIALTIVKTKKEFAQICKYVSLASDYQEFSGISSRSTQLTQERELAKMKDMGNKLFDVHYGKTEAQKIHDAKDADIKSDYERNLKLLVTDYENVKAQIERERDKAIKRIQNDASEEESSFYSEKEELQSEIEKLTIGISAIDDRIGILQNDIEENEQFLDAFETNYNVLEQKLQDEKWMPPMEYTHGKLSDELYVIPETGFSDSYHHKQAYRITHNKKAVVVTYDISDIADVDGSQVEKVGKIIRDLMFDLMYSVYRMNSKETYAQFVVDGVGGANGLKSNNVKNAFNIVDVVGKVEDIRGRLREFAAQREKFAEKGTKIDDVNESKYKAQDRPEVYTILYIIYKPDERKSKLDDDIRNLIPECDKYGFLPVFICEKDTWERELQEKESIYKDIKSLTNNPIVIFDGTKYSDYTNNVNTEG